MRYPCSKNKGRKINFKFAICIILNYGIHQQIEKNSGFYLMYCFSKSHFVIRRYHHFAPRATNHCCQSLSCFLALERVAIPVLLTFLRLPSFLDLSNMKLYRCSSRLCFNLHNSASSCRLSIIFFFFFFYLYVLPGTWCSA